MRKGTLEEAKLYAIGANRANSLRMKPADKRNTVQWCLEHPKWSQWSDREIGRRCGVSHPFVASVHGELASGNDYQIPETRKVRRNGTVYEQRDRRNLSDADLARWVSELERRHRGKPTTGAKSSPRTLSDIAETIGVSEARVKKASAVDRKAVPEVKAAVERGELFS